MSAAPGPRPPRTPPSVITAHPACAGCADFSGWLRARDRAERLGTAPRRCPAGGLEWLRAYFTPGPSRRPAHWCDLLVAEHVDGGALADLVMRVLTGRGVPCDRLQVISRAVPSHASLRRTSSGDRVVRHEALVLHLPGGAELFDPAALAYVPVVASEWVQWLRYWPDGEGRERPSVCWAGVTLRARCWTWAGGPR